MQLVPLICAPQVTILTIKVCAWHEFVLKQCISKLSLFDVYAQLLAGGHADSGRGARGGQAAVLGAVPSAVHGAFPGVREAHRPERGAPALLLRHGRSPREDARAAGEVHRGGAQQPGRGLRTA